VNGTPLILLSGMGADARMFAKIRPMLPNLIVPHWLPPIAGESMKDYARRMAAHIDPGGPCYIGGASFGGFLALEMIPYLNARGCFLIGAVRRPGELPALLRWLRPAKPLLRVLPLQLFWWASGVMAALLGPVLPRRMSEFLWLGSSLDPEFFRWSAGALLDWAVSDSQSTPGRTAVASTFGGVPVYQIHGRRDRVLPAARTRPDVLIPRGGHVIALSHPREVAGFIAARISADLTPTPVPA
jgi:pimeloyl-ACP methyl ester carboxylesterase